MARGGALRTWNKRRAEGPPSPEFSEFLALVFKTGEMYPVTCQDFERAWMHWILDFQEASFVATTKQKVEASWVIEAWMTALRYRTTKASAENGWFAEHERGEAVRWRGLSWR